MITTSISAFTPPAHKLSTHTAPPVTGLSASAFVSKPAFTPRINTNSLFSNSAPLSLPPRLTSIKAVPDDAMDINERISEHPAFQACQRSNMLSRMRRPDNTQLEHLNDMATIGLKKIDRAIDALKNGNPEMKKRADALFGDSVKPETLIKGLKNIKANLEQVRKQGAYAIDPDIDDCPCEAFTILQELPAKQEPFVIFLRGYFFNPPKEMSMIYKSKDDYQAHTLVHEATHLALRSHDVELSNGMPAYSPYGCMALRQEQPNRTTDNADSWAWLVA